MRKWIGWSYYNHCMLLIRCCYKVESASINLMLFRAPMRNQVQQWPLLFQFPIATKLSCFSASLWPPMLSLFCSLLLLSSPSKFLWVAVDISRDRSQGTSRGTSSSVFLSNIPDHTTQRVGWGKKRKGLDQYWLLHRWTQRTTTFPLSLYLSISFFSLDFSHTVFSEGEREREYESRGGFSQWFQRLSVLSGSLFFSSNKWSWP